MDGPIIGYVRICDDSLTHGGNLDPIWTQKVFFGVILKEFWLFWDLELILLIIPKDAVFAKILVFSNIFGFPTVNWAPIWTLTAFHLSQKSRFGRIFQTVFILLETTSGQSFSKIKQYLGE